MMLQLSRLPAKVNHGPVVAAMGRTLAALAQLVRGAESTIRITSICFARPPPSRGARTAR